MLISESQITTKPKPKKRRSKKTVVQRHHLRYLHIDGYDWTEPIYKNEHYAITLLNRRKTPSVGILTVLQDFIDRNRAKAVNLEGTAK